jgi:hypothetical protein
MNNNNIYRKLAAFQWECPVIIKKTQGYGYKYADLATIIETIQPLLQKHRLGFYQSMTEKGMLTVVFDVDSGEKIESLMPVPQLVEFKGMNIYQVDGARVTYYRRYALSCLLGLCADIDTDAYGEEVKSSLPSRIESSSTNQNLENPVASLIEKLYQLSQSNADKEQYVEYLLKGYDILIERGLKTQSNKEAFGEILNSEQTTQTMLRGYCLKMAERLQKL